MDEEFTSTLPNAPPLMQNYVAGDSASRKHPHEDLGADSTDIPSSATIVGEYQPMHVDEKSSEKQETPSALLKSSTFCLFPWPLPEILDCRGLERPSDFGLSRLRIAGTNVFAAFDKGEL